MTANCAASHMLFFEFKLILEVLQASARVAIVIMDIGKGRMADLMDLIGMVNDTCVALSCTYCTFIPCRSAPYGFCHTALPHTYICRLYIIL